jgi:hypothetical protein
VSSSSSHRRRARAHQARGANSHRQCSLNPDRTSLIDHGSGRPSVDLEAVRTYANNLPVDQLEPAARDAWHSAKLADEIDPPRIFYTVAFIASRIADERLWEQLAGARS